MMLSCRHTPSDSRELILGIHLHIYLGLHSLFIETRCLGQCNNQDETALRRKCAWCLVLFTEILLGRQLQPPNQIAHHMISAPVSMTPLVGTLWILTRACWTWLTLLVTMISFTVSLLSESEEKSNQFWTETTPT